jgi:hypothetical protein
VGAGHLNGERAFASLDTLMWCGLVRRGVDSGSRHRPDGVGRKKAPPSAGPDGHQERPNEFRRSAATTDVGVRLAQPSHTVTAISAASDHRGAVEALISGLSGSGKPLIHSSGSSIVADLAIGEPSDRIFDEMTPIVPLTERAARIAIDQLVAYGPRHPISGALQSMIYGVLWALRRRASRYPHWYVRLRYPVWPVTSDAG